MKSLPTITKPGELIKNELRERHISQNAFAKAIGVGFFHMKTEFINSQQMILARLMEERRCAMN